VLRKANLKIGIARIMNLRLHHCKNNKKESRESQNNKMYPSKHLGIISIPCNDYKKKFRKIAENKEERNDALKRMNTMPNDPMPTLCCGKGTAKYAMQSFDSRSVVSRSE
jgi:hypothetical protein